MALIEWQEHFKLGIPAVDHEHEELIGLLNELYEDLERGAEPAEIIDFLGEVHSRISAHFALEERVMAERNYPQFEAHKADHEKLLDEIRDVMDDYEEGRWRDSLEAFGARLESWFGDHFRSHDARLHRMLGDIVHRPKA